jgi:ABC-type transport system involved in Fe-S cluster assembly fused permease/ATPase subunit
MITCENVLSTHAEEAILQRALRRLVGRSTNVVIAYRLSAIHNPDLYRRQFREPARTGPG